MKQAAAGHPRDAGKSGDSGDSGNIADASVMDADAVAKALGVNVETGLSATDAASRLASHGLNELRAAPPVAAWRRVLAQFQDPLIYLLLAAVAVALVAWWVEGADAQGRGWPVDAIVIAAVILLNAVIGHVQEAKAQNAVAALAKMTAATAAVLRDGKPQRVPSAEDRRSASITLTDQGRRIVDDVFPRELEAHGRLFDVLGARRNRVLEALTTLAESMESGLPSR